MGNKSNEDSALGKVFGLIGAAASISAGTSSDMGVGGIFILVLVCASAGYAIGEWVEALIVRILFFVGAIIMFLINATIRKFIWDIISSFF